MINRSKWLTIIKNLYLIKVFLLIFSLFNSTKNIPTGPLAMQDSLRYNYQQYVEAACICNLFLSVSQVLRYFQKQKTYISKIQILASVMRSVIGNILLAIYVLYTSVCTHLTYDCNMLLPCYAAFFSFNTYFCLSCLAIWRKFCLLCSVYMLEVCMYIYKCLVLLLPSWVDACFWGYCVTFDVIGVKIVAVCCFALSSPKNRWSLTVMMMWMGVWNAN